MLKKLLLNLKAARRNYFNQMVGLYFVLLFIMYIFQIAKHIVWPGMTVWGSHHITNIIFAFLAVVTVHIIVRQKSRLLQHATEEVTKRRSAEKILRDLSTRLEWERTKLEEVLSIEEQLNSLLRVNKITDFIVQKTAKILEAKKCSLMFVDEHSRELCIKGHIGLDDKIIEHGRESIEDSLAGQIIQQGRPILVKDIETDSLLARQNRPSYDSKSFVSAPIRLGNQIIGLINVADKNSKDIQIFSELDLKILCMIARNVGVTLENAKLYQEMQYLTITDPMTNMHNYRFFVKTIDREIQRLKRYGGALSLLMIDVDNLKSYNDSFGHLDGDLLLQKIGNAITSAIREVDVACRYAGDEFAVILPETRITEANVVALKIIESVQSLPLKKQMTISIGVAKYSGNMTRHDLVMRADTALYQAKRTGKNKVFADTGY
jgi:diguanylate cyclase (GGDEF)-like protein